MSDQARITDGAYGALVRASPIDTLRFIGNVALPTFGKGILIRRPTMEAAAERMGFDTDAVRAMQRLRRKYGPKPLQLAEKNLLLTSPKLDPDQLPRTLNHFEIRIGLV